MINLSSTHWPRTLLAGVMVTLTACSTTATVAPPAARERSVIAPATPTPYPSTYKPAASVPTLIRGATVLIGNGERLDDADVLMSDGKITAVGRTLEVPIGAVVIDGRGKW
ncbi:MAG: hypothetical protein ACKO3O_02400, partial [Gammaproteobacteria bacterium]